jgi:hypothetical protein
MENAFSDSDAVYGIYVYEITDSKERSVYVACLEGNRSGPTEEK